MVNGMTIIEYDQSELKNKLSQTWEKIKTILLTNLNFKK
jgi:hypothetical protein